MEDSSLGPDTLGLFRDAVIKHPETRLAIQVLLFFLRAVIGR